MASPVDTSVKFFHSGMTGAPVLNGVAGSGVALLDACLADGFGTKTLTSLVVAGGIATASFAGTFPGVPQAVSLIDGVTGTLTALNGEQKITEVGSGYIKFATAAPNGTAAGTVTMKMAPLGFAKAFTGTNLRAYRSTDVSGVRHYLRVNDTGTMDMRVVGYETMTAISTGTNLFPTNAQMNGGGYWPKTLAAGAGEIASWFIIGNAKRFYFCSAAGEVTSYSGGAADGMNIAMFGEFKSLKATADAYNSAIFSAAGANSMAYSMAVTTGWSGQPSMAIARLHTNAVGARLLDLRPFMPSSGNDSGATGNALGPANGVPATLILNNLFLGIDTATYGPRGLLPEMFHCNQAVPGSFNILKGDLVPGSGPAAGRMLIAVPGSTSPAASFDGTNRRVTLFDITGPWP